MVTQKGEEEPPGGFTAAQGKEGGRVCAE